MGHLGIMILKRTGYKIWALVDFVKGPRNWGFAIDWLLYEREANFITDF